MLGWMRYRDGHVKTLHGNKPDRFSLGDLLRAANTSLEELSDGKAHQTASMRFRGLELMVKIDYRNRPDETSSWAWSATIPNPSYEITVRRIPFAEYKVTEVGYLPHTTGEAEVGLTQRRLTNRFGVKLHFTQTGQIARFSWNALVMEIVAGLTLLSIAQLIVDNVAYYVHPHNKAIEQVVYEEFEEERWRRWTKVADYKKAQAAGGVAARAAAKAAGASGKAD